MNKTFPPLKPIFNPQLIEERLGVSLEILSLFCQRRQISELALFGSVLRDDFKGESDIDFLVTFSREAKIGLTELEEIEDELQKMVGREIDFVFRNSIEASQNWIRRRNILETAEVIYGA